MGYKSIPNLYKAQQILMMRECYALEKIHGTSCHIQCKLLETAAESAKVHQNSPEPDSIIRGFNDDFLCQKAISKIIIFSGGIKHDTFAKLFEDGEVQRKLTEFSIECDRSVTVYGEGYGGSCQKMSKTYGPDIKFIAFEVKIGDVWLDVPEAERVVTKLGLEFVAYEKVSTDVEILDKERDRDSRQAVRNGMGKHMAEGVVVKPIVNMFNRQGHRIMIAKHKRDDFRETRTPREVSPEQLQIMEDAKSIAQEWVVAMRLQHVLDKMPGVEMKDMNKIIKAMQNDIQIEAEGEIVWSKPVAKAIGKQTAQLVKQYFQDQLG